MVLAQIPRNLTTESRLLITHWHANRIVLAEPVRQWLEHHGFEYSLYRTAAQVIFSKDLTYATGMSGAAINSMHVRRFYIEFQEPRQLMLFKLAHDGVTNATEKDLGYI